MKLLIVLLLLPVAGFSQIFYEHLYETTKTYSPWFGNNSGMLTVSLELAYREGGDSTMSLILDIAQTKSTVAGSATSIGMAAGGSGLVSAIAGSFSTAKSYSITNTNGIAVFDQKSYDSLIVVLKRLKDISKQYSSYGKTVLFKVNKVIVGLDIRIKYKNDGTGMQKKLEKSYYFKIDDSSFRLSESEFDDLYENSLEVLAESFRQFNTIRSIVVPVAK